MSLSTETLRRVSSRGDNWAWKSRLVYDPSFEVTDSCAACQQVSYPENFNYSIVRDRQHGEGEERHERRSINPQTVEDARLKKSHGCQSLQDTTIEIIVKNIHRMSYESLKCLKPLPILLNRIWDKIWRRQIMTLDSWKMFCKLLLDERRVPPCIYLYKQCIIGPVSPLGFYLNPLKSSDFEFMTRLTITVKFPFSSLLKVSSLRNLSALDLLGSWEGSIGFSKVKPRQRTEKRPEDYMNNLLLPEDYLNDRLIRMWAESATSDREAFPALRSLRLVRCEHFTLKCLAHLNAFSALRMVDFEGCAMDPYEAEDLMQSNGWTLIAPEHHPKSNFAKPATTSNLDRLHTATPYNYQQKYTSPRREAKDTSELLDVGIYDGIVFKTFLAQENEDRQILCEKYLANSVLPDAQKAIIREERNSNWASEDKHSPTPVAVIRLGSACDHRYVRRMAFYRVEIKAHAGFKLDDQGGTRKRPREAVIRESKKQDLSTMMDLMR